MDIVLEVFDTFVFDRAYATFLPAISHGASYDAPLKANATFSSMRELPTHNAYQYRPASDFISFEPSKYAYMSQWNRDNVFRQTLSLYLITWLFGLVIYFVFATLSYWLVFDKTAKNHPKYLRNQMWLEMKQANIAMPIMAIFTVPCFVLEVRGYSKMYGSWTWSFYDFLQFPLFLTFTDGFIYWIHRGLHHPKIYKHLHKPHHKWIMPTPFASHAFHPLDGFAQSVPYHVFPFIFPLNKLAYVGLFVFINIWTVMIHDGDYIANSPIINGAACHTMHHLYFNFNYGQFTTLWDRLGGSYRKPNDELFRRETKFGNEEWNRQKAEMEKIVKEVEGEDDRTYEPADVKKTK